MITEQEKARRAAFIALEESKNNTMRYIRKLGMNAFLRFIRRPFWWWFTRKDGQQDNKKTTFDLYSYHVIEKVYEAYNHKDSKIRIKAIHDDFINGKIKIPKFDLSCKACKEVQLYGFGGLLLEEEVENITQFLNKHKGHSILFAEESGKDYHRDADHDCKCFKCVD